MDRLLKLLSENAKFTTEELSAMLNDSEENIDKKIAEYEKNGIIKGYQALINWDKVADAGVTAFIELKVTPKKSTGFDEIAALVSAFDEVESVYLIAGSYDLLVTVNGKTIQEIAMFVSKRLSTIEGVISTATHFLLTKYKDSGVILNNEDHEDKRSMIL
ncbi:MAG: Lrp/AsnC family transcriptional regulator [Acutalibacteraceae bacterium]